MTIRREDLKHAIDLIGEDDPEAGHVLDEMLARGGIGPLPGADEESPGQEVFAFGAESVTVQRGQFFSLGPRALSERLLVKYGEMLARHGLEAGGGGVSPAAAARRIRAGGPRCLVTHELRRILDAGRAPPPADSLLLRLLTEDAPAPLPWRGGDPGVLYSGVVDRDTPALFLRFPWCRASLEQAAALNLEFFGTGQLLEKLCRGEARYLYAAVVAGRLVGLLDLAPRVEYGADRLEIRYLAARPEPTVGLRSRPCGVGSLLVAGAWLQWRCEHGDLRGLVLASELGALDFYEKQGFRRRRVCEYAMDAPRGRTLRCLVAMANRAVDLPERLKTEIAKYVDREARRLARSCPDRITDRKDRRVLSTALFFEECFRASALPDVVAAATGRLVEHGQGRELCERLLESAAEYGYVHRRGRGAPETPPVLVVMEDRFAGHLSKLVHLDSPGRLEAVQRVLADPELADAWRKVPARRATVAELSRVHTKEHIARIAHTSGRRHTVLDADTETTAESFEAARLAVGGLLNLLDALMKGPSHRGFAFLRPPGHHAAPDRPKGFCLFNNVALGARHLIERHSLERVMIVDVDAHHGDGTQAAFYDTDAVLYFSLHGHDGFPGTGRVGEIGRGRGTGYTVNLPLPNRLGDRTLAGLLRRVVPSLARSYRPDFLLVSLGFDLYAHDPLGRMSVTPDGYSLIASLLSACADEIADGHIAFVLEGGYSRCGLEECGAAVMRALASYPDEVGRFNDFMERPPEVESYLERLKIEHGGRWPLQATRLSS